MALRQSFEAMVREIVEHMDAAAGRLAELDTHIKHYPAHVHPSTAQHVSKMLHQLEKMSGFLDTMRAAGRFAPGAPTYIGSYTAAVKEEV